MKALVVFYSMYGHVYRMAKAVAEGATEVPGAEVDLRRVPETLPQQVLDTMGAAGFQKTLADVPVCTVEDLKAADAIFFGTPTRFGNMCGQMRQFLDATGGSPYGASTFAGTQGERAPSGNELAAARFQGRHVATIAAKLAG